jgi:hypothetical protein
MPNACCREHSLYKSTVNGKNFSMVEMTTFPQEFYIELSGLSPFLVGRIVVTQHGEGFNAEVDIVQHESGKIHNHVTILYNEADAREALDLAVHHLKQYLERKLN